MESAPSHSLESTVSNSVIAVPSSQAIGSGSVVDGFAVRHLPPRGQRQVPVIMRHGLGRQRLRLDYLPQAAIRTVEFFGRRPAVLVSTDLLRVRRAWRKGRSSVVTHELVEQRVQRPANLALERQYKVTRGM